MSNRREGGFALLTALWLLVTISVASLALESAARTRRLSAANLAEGIRAQAAAQAGIEQVRARLVRRLAEWTLNLEGADPWTNVDSLLSDTLTIGAAQVGVAVRDVGAQLNLNVATDDELRRLFTALRIDAGQADRLAQCILDWRDADDLHRARGAERDAYLRAGAVDLPRNGPFQSIAELRAVQGMSADLYERVQPYLTLLGSGQVNVNVAERPVLLALPGITEDAVAVLFRYRRQRRVLGSIMDLERDLPSGARAVFASHLPELLGRTTTETRELQVTSDAVLGGSPVRARVTGVFVRARSAVFYVWARAE
jgi:general secretion pathway protein K